MDILAPLPSVVDSMRRQYARAHAHRLTEKLGGLTNEVWLSVELDEILKGYAEGLEQVAKEYEKRALEAFRLAPTPPILVKKQ